MKPQRRDATTSDSAVEQQLKGFTLSSGRREELKWLGAILMVVDHANGYLVGGAYPVMYEAGRLVYPLFAVVLAYNLAGAGETALKSVLARLLVFGVVAQPFTMLLRFPIMSGEITQAAVWWHGNILFTFAVGVGFVLIMERAQRRAVKVGILLLALAAGFLVDFRWAGVAYFVCAYTMFARRRMSALIAFGAANVTLALENLSFASLFALPLLVSASGGKSAVRRRRGFFYVFYPLHLAVIWVVRIAWSS